MQSPKMTVQRRLDSTKWDHERLERRVKGLEDELAEAQNRNKESAQETEAVFAQIRSVQRERDEFETKNAHLDTYH